jgi:hypothetical protein
MDRSNAIRRVSPRETGPILTGCRVNVRISSAAKTRSAKRTPQMKIFVFTGENIRKWRLEE